MVLFFFFISVFVVKLCIIGLGGFKDIDCWFFGIGGLWESKVIIFRGLFFLFFSVVIVIFIFKKFLEFGY